MWVVQLAVATKTKAVSFVFDRVAVNGQPSIWRYEVCVPWPVPAIIGTEYGYCLEQRPEEVARGRAPAQNNTGADTTHPHPALIRGVPRATCPCHPCLSRTTSDHCALDNPRVLKASYVVPS